uniref:Uncharacterized protein n=1 Tax=Lactuca sativa TaxID=4236 RepID=A0A9R1VUG9_LACSA|nr:hypothetical protein LSAT_V11C400169330 [Lactuca sativa]
MRLPLQKYPFFPPTTYCRIRCNWATKGAGVSDERQGSDSKGVVELTNGSSGMQYSRHNNSLLRRAVSDSSSNLLPCPAIFQSSCIQL